MSEKKQTAVEWLVEQYTQGNYSWEVYDKAKEMEKQQIIDAYDQGDIQLVNGEQYYNETYGGNNE
jgi:TRAP-type C4-dicarboxylate transport system substrate-binding protein